MMKRSLIAALGASTLVGSSVLGLATAAQAAPTTAKVVFECSMPDFPTAPPFDYEASVDVEAFVDAAGASAVTLVMSTSDLPGVVPAFISMKDQAVEVSFEGKANGEPVTISTKGTTDVNPTNNGSTKDPVKLPGNIQGTVTTGTSPITLELSKFDFNVAGVGGGCTFKSGSIPALTPTVGAAPAPNGAGSPSPSASSSPSATATATGSPSATSSPSAKGAAGKAAKGQITFACVLSAPFNTKFDYKADITVNGARENAEDTAVALSATFSDIPGLAPVPIADGKMEITVKGTVAGEAATFTGNSTVNVAANEVVPVPQLSADIETDAEKGAVEIETFAFAFGEMSGLSISADCEAKSGKLSELAIAVGELPGGSAGGSDSSGSGTTTSLPRTGGADAMPVIALWALALGVAGAGLLVWMPRRRQA